MPETQRRDCLTRRSGIVTAALGLLLACGAGCAPDRTTLLEVTYNKGELWLHAPDGASSRRVGSIGEGVRQVHRWQPHSLAVLRTSGRVDIHDLISGTTTSELPGRYIGLASSTALDQLAAAERPQRNGSLTVKLFDRTLQEKGSFDVSISVKADSDTDVIISWSTDDSALAISKQWRFSQGKRQTKGPCEAVLVNLKDMSTTTLPLCDVLFLPEGRIAAARGTKSDRYEVDSWRWRDGGSSGDRSYSVGVDAWRWRDGEYKYDWPISYIGPMAAAALPARRIVTWEGRIPLIDPLVDAWSRVAVREGVPPYRRLGRTRNVLNDSMILILEEAPDLPEVSDSEQYIRWRGHRR